MSYKINFTDNINKESLTINDNVINTSTSLEFPGRNQKGYAITIAENFLHLLENFSKNASPSNPIQGQLWYDSTPGVENLMIYDGTLWKSASSLKKGSNAPSSNVLGDLWVDSTKKQLKLWNGSSWSLVGPTYSSGLLTGSVAELLKDQTANQTEHAILKNVVDDTVVSIISNTAFTPNPGIPGFETIKIGINLNNNSSNRFWGISEKAENLIVANKTIPSANFLRSDLSNTTFYEFIVRNDLGLTLGNEKQLQMYISDSRSVFYHSTQGSRMDFRINSPVTSEPTTILSLDSTTGSILIGNGNNDSTATLSVKGNSKLTGVVAITDITETLNVSTGALLVSGGVSISKQLRIAGEVTANSQINSKSIIPIENNTSNLGSSSNKFSNVYANSIYGNTIEAESFFGTFTGDIVGSASNLISGTTFKIEGDVTSNSFTFNGDGSPKTFTTVIGPDFIKNKVSLPNTLDVDQILVYRPYVPGSDITAGIYKTNKSMLTSNLALVPVGTILPFAGVTVPSGYLLCDGSEKRVGDYNKLFNIIQYTYGPSSSLQGLNTFKLPDLRGRFPLGLNNMDNGDQVPNGSDNGLTSIPSGGGRASRVTSDTGNTLGMGAGNQQVTVDISQIPNHSHTLQGNNGGQFYAINSDTTTPSDTNAIIGNGLSESVQSQYLSTTSGVDSAPLGQPITIMNPYLSINYIIYAGAIST